MKFTSPVFFLSLVILSACGPNNSRETSQIPPRLEGWGTPAYEQAAGPFDLRGFGKISADGKLWKTPRGEVGLVRFRAADEAKASILASKYVADLTAYGAVTPAQLPEGFGGAAYTVRHSGLWVIGRDGADVYVLSGPDSQLLAAQAGPLGAKNWKAPAKDAYPKYLDCFDNAALGMWWMPNTKSPEILEFFRENIGIVNAHPHTSKELGKSFAPNVFDYSSEENIVAQARLINKPYRMMLWGALPSWWRWSSDPRQAMEGPAPGDLMLSLFEANYYTALQVASPEAEAVFMDRVVRTMRQFQDDENLLAWLEPHGEFNLYDPRLKPPGAERGFIEDLKKRGYTLDAANQAFGLQATSWENFPYPEMAYFFGRKGNFLDLDNHPWRWKPLVSQQSGTEQGFGAETFDDTAWAEDLRSSLRLQNQVKDQGNVHPLWYRFQAEIPSSIREGGRVFLNIMPYTERNTATAAVWVNGQEVSNALNSAENNYKREHLAYDVTDLLRPGKNQFAIYSNGGHIASRVFLNNTPAEAYPYKDAAMSRYWLAWNDYLIATKLQTLERWLVLMRSIDPVRPIKLMTPHLFQTEAMDLMERYGGYPQLTGEGPEFFRPMHYKGYSRLRGLPASSEGGGPPQNEKEIQGMFSNIFWENQDCHDYVFDPERDFWSKPGCKDWWKRNGPLLKTLGKIDFGPIRVGELRDTEQESLYRNEELYNWDLARGPLPSVGISPVLIDGKEFDRNMAADIPVVFDCATSVMSPERVAAVLRYVENGGTFIALHNTGRHTPLERDSWPLAKALNLKIEDYRITKDNFHSWPLDKILFSADQNLVPSLKGKAMEGCGISIDYQGNQREGAVKISGQGPTVKPVATWSDGSMAVCEVSLGKGKLIWLGTPFFLRFKDESGKWMNGDGRQALLVELLEGLGVKRETESSDPRVWVEKRESKNGLYDVFIASAKNIRGSDWKLDDVITTTLKLRGVGNVPVIDATEAGTPDVAAVAIDGGMEVPDQKFHPFQTRQFATLRANAVLEAPLHWLEVQRRQWRALEVPPPQPDVAAIVAEQAKKMGEDGMNLSETWKVRKFASSASPENDWIKAGFDVSGWDDGRLGTWLVNGWRDAKTVQYRRQVNVPAEWLLHGRRVLLGFAADFHQMGVKDKGRLWLNGKPLEVPFENPVLVDITDRAVGGKLDIALQVEGQPMTGGVGGVLYLRSVPAPKETLQLDGDWVTVSSWDTVSGAVTLPGRVDKVFGIRKSFDLPEGWEGRKVRVVVDQGTSGNIEGCIINGVGYFFCPRDVMSPYGVRIDQWLKPGTNEIDLYPSGHVNPQYQKSASMNANVRSIRLECYE